MISKSLRHSGTILGLAIMLVSPIKGQGFHGSIQPKIPQLGNHRFITNPIVRDPFIQTHFRNTLGFGQALDLNLPILTVGDDVVWGLRGDLMFVKLEFAYQYGFKDWMAPFIQFNINSRLGSGIQALLAQGISASVNMEFGWMFKLYQSERSMLSATTNLWNSSGTIINFYDFITSIVEEGGLVPENQLVRNRPYLRGGGGLRYAWAATELVGLNLIGELAYGESVDRRVENTLYYKMGGSADLDIGQTKYAIPVGFGFGFISDSFPSGGDNTIAGNTNDFFLRVAYTGRSDFMLALDLWWTHLPLKQLDQKLNTIITTINMKYFF